MPEDFKREEILLDDGGTVGLDWDGPIPTEEAPLDKPLLVFIPGLGGGSSNLYTLQLLWLARQAGYRCVTVLFRGSQGMPITSGKLHNGGHWGDLD